MVAALTGHRVDELDKSLVQKTADFLPFIWKKFAEKGYATAYNEDRPDIGLFGFNYIPGFAKKDFDFLYLTYWRAVQNYFSSHGFSFHYTPCFKNYPNVIKFIDIIERHVNKMNKFLQFSYNFFVYYSHEEKGTQIEWADDAYFKFFRRAFENGRLNKTVIIFMGDHGHRFSPIRKTLVGLLEERNPFLGVWLPEWFYKLHPSVKTNLAINIERFVSTFDIHETLMDVLRENFNAHQNQTHRGMKRGLSLLREVPTNRTCKDAGVPSTYCLCREQVTVNVNDMQVREAGKALVYKLNKILSKYTKCMRIQYKKILRAESLEYSDESVREHLKSLSSANATDYGRAQATFRIAVSTKPNKAIFEATVVKNSLGWTVKGDIQRLSAYKNSSYCMEDPILRKYCTCKSQISLSP